MDKKNRHTDMKRMVMMGAISAIASELFKPLIDDGVAYLKARALYSVDISNMLGSITPALHEKFPNFPDRVEFRMGESQYQKGKIVDVTCLEWGFMRGYVDYIVYHGTPIFVKIEKFTHVERGGTNAEGAWLITINQSHHKERLMEFLDELSETARQLSIQSRFDTFNVRMMSVKNGMINTDWIAHELRTFDDVFIPSDQKKQLIDAVDAYINNREFYIENNLPNHFGVLLYGSGGTGKSSLAQAIASHIDAELIVASGDTISYITEIMGRMSQHSMDDSMYRVLLFEDIDSGLFNLTRENKDKEKDKNEVGMATILNALDGIGSPTNVIYVFTTNHIEALDPAFIRPGRCDLKLEIKGVTTETLKEFMTFHYPDAKITYPDSDIKPGLTFAELQTHVMEGKNPDEIIKFAYNI